MSGLCALSERFITTFDGALSVYAAGYSASNVTLEECYALCASNSTWPGCVGFTRYSAQYGGGASARDSCWWTDDESLLLDDDANNNEDLYTHVACPPTSCDGVEGAPFLCDKTGGSGAYDAIASGDVAGSYTTAAGTLEECFSRCDDGTWPGCVGFSRSNGDSSASSGCWWVSKAEDFRYGSTSGSTLYVRNPPAATCIASCAANCEGYNLPSAGGECLLGRLPPLAPPALPPTAPPPPAAPPGLCTESCNGQVAGARVGVCDDGVGSVDGSAGLCPVGSDCEDCGARTFCQPGSECPTECYAKGLAALAAPGGRHSVCLRGMPANGRCDTGCNDLACGYDGGDCSIGQIIDACIEAVNRRAATVASHATPPATTVAVALRLQLGRLTIKARCASAGDTGCQEGAVVASTQATLTTQWSDRRLFSNECLGALTDMMSLDASAEDKASRQIEQRSYAKQVLYLPPARFESGLHATWPQAVDSASFTLNTSQTWLSTLPAGVATTEGSPTASPGVCTDCATYTQVVDIEVKQHDWDFYLYPFGASCALPPSCALPCLPPRHPLVPCHICHLMYLATSRPPHVSCHLATSCALPPRHVFTCAARARATSIELPCRHHPAAHAPPRPLADTTLLRTARAAAVRPLRAALDLAPSPPPASSDRHVLSINVTIPHTTLVGCEDLAATLREAAGDDGHALLPANNAWLLRSLPDSQHAIDAALAAGDASKCVVRVGLRRNSAIFTIKNIAVIMISAPQLALPRAHRHASQRLRSPPPHIWHADGTTFHRRSLPTTALRATCPLSIRLPVPNLSIYTPGVAAPRLLPPSRPHPINPPRLPLYPPCSHAGGHAGPVAGAQRPADRRALLDLHLRNGVGRPTLYER